MTGEDREATTLYELRRARHEGARRITARGAAARRLRLMRRLRISLGTVLVLGSLFLWPVRNLIEEPEGYFPGPAPGFKYPLSSGSPPTVAELAAMALLLAAGIVVLWKPWARYTSATVSTEELTVVMLRKQR